MLKLVEKLTVSEETQGNLFCEWYGTVAWLPDRDSDRTNAPKAAWEITPYYTRSYDKSCRFFRGEKPAELAQFAKISARRWEQHERDQARENPIHRGLRYLKVFENESVTTYAEAAEILGISRQRVFQLTSLVTRLPKDVVDFLANAEDPRIIRYFSERRLRSVVTLISDQAKVAEFESMLKEMMNSKARVRHCDVRQQ